MYVREQEDFYNSKARFLDLASSARGPTNDPIGQRGMNCGQGLSEQSG